MNTQTKVSVIIPCYNYAHYLDNCLKNLLQQSHKNLEIIVVNDGSTDNCNEKIQPYLNKIVYIEKENKGLSAARNTGINAADGEYLGYLDDDDYLYPDHTVVLLGALLGGHRIGYSDAAVQYNNGPARLYMSNNWDAEQIKRGNLFPVCCVMHEASLIDESGYFDEDLPSHEDWDMWIRMSEICDFVHVPMMTCVVDQTQTGMMSDANIMNRGHEMVLEKYG